MSVYDVHKDSKRNPSNTHESVSFCSEPKSEAGLQTTCLHRRGIGDQPALTLVGIQYSFDMSGFLHPIREVLTQLNCFRITHFQIADVTKARRVLQMPLEAL